MDKITIVAHGLGNGGAERVASILANGLCDAGYKIQYISVYNNIVTYELNSSIEYIYLNEETPNKLAKYLNRSMRLFRIINEFEPNEVISFLTQEMLLTSIFSKKKIIFSERTDPSAKPKYLQRITEFVYKRAYRVVFQTYGAREYFDSEIQEKGYIIANPMEENLPEWDMENHNKDIITACRITPEKNLEMMIKGFAWCSSKFPDYRLVIYGTPRYEEAQTQLEQLAKSLDLDGRVLFPGFSKDIRSDMANAAMFVLTSNYEGLSNSMLEALCIGVPTICTDCPSGGARQYIADGQNGFLVSVDDDVQLGKKMIMLLNDEGLQSKVSMNSKILKDELRVGKIIDSWIEILE